MWARSQSLEWSTHISDTVAVAEVKAVEPAKPDNEYADTQIVHFAQTELLKGKSTGSWIFHENYARDWKIN